ncbi:Leucine-rich repeat-containing protein 9 [Bagarius yarrelli]|uniref:Leucine-rich repeat-containing protein 9 n=1 Tax=Bagarius yarrelli TaxID=175774 RepID=A0A556V4D4_BAGYA|nr:Leucine-rich repeat-containing protein 9 [Bagarius yarrelli]
MTLSDKERQNDEEMIKDLCVCNGMSYENICEDGSEVEALEMFFSGFPRMVGLSRFPRLLTLTIVGQDVCKIQGLDDCPLLRELWVAECQLTEITGLQKCVQLEKLFLYDNKISEIRELEPLINLKVLWLNNNLIPELKELTQLACLTELKELALNDPQSSPNPVCLLFNYFTHLLYHIPSLHTIDSYDVSEKNIKDAVELECESEAAGRKLSGLREEVTSEWLEKRFRLDVAMASDRKDMSIHFLVMELETVGNIRFEEGNTSHAWFKPCYDLLLSRFCALDFKAYNIAGIKINRIMRVHNRHLRLLFEDKLCTLLANNESSLFSQNYRRRLEYLFYVFDPERCAEAIQRTHEILNILENGFKSASVYKAVGRDSAVPLSNSISVCEEPRIRLVWQKATRCGAESTEEPLPITQGQLIVSKAFLGHSVPLRAGVPVDEEFYPKAHSVYHGVCSSELQGCCDCSQKQTLWYIFHPELVLPEYLIDFEYITQERSQSTSWSNPDPPGAPVGPDDVTPVANDEQALDDQVLALEPVLKPHTKLLSLDEQDLLTAARANVLSQITVLNLHGNSLSRLKELSGLIALRQLTVSFNALTHLDDISFLYNLEYVDASFNQIVTLKGVRGLPRLRELDLRWNKLSRAREEMSVLCKHTSFLQRLDIRHNQWRQVRRLLLLSVCLCVVWYYALVSYTTVNLDGQHLSHIDNLEQLVNLRWASFNNNQLTDIEGLQHCLLLEELSLNHNYICALEGLSKLQRLTRFSINSNQLQCLDTSVLECLTNLHFLSVEDNCITCLQGVQRLRFLFELYVGNNNISTSRDVYHMKFENATEVFGGRLTADMLTEKLGHSNYKEMVELELPGCSVRMVDLVPAELFKNLRILNLERNNLTSFSGLVYLPNIKVECVCVESLEPLMCSLEVLHLGYNGISNLSYLQLGRLSSLKALFLQGNEIVHVEGLDGLSHLCELVLDQNRVKTLCEKWFRSHTRLIELSLNDNRLRNLTNLQLIHLQRLHLNNNKLQTICDFASASAADS